MRRDQFSVLLTYLRGFFCTSFETEIIGRRDTLYFVSKDIRYWDMCIVVILDANARTRVDQRALLQNGSGEQMPRFLFVTISAAKSNFEPARDARLRHDAAGRGNNRHSILGQFLLQLRN
jgi:hypothetical protein